MHPLLSLHPLRSPYAWSSSAACLAFLLMTLAPGALVHADPDDTTAGKAQALALESGDNKLVIQPPPLEGLTSDSRTESWAPWWWHGKVGESAVEVVVRYYDKEEYGFVSPGDVAEQALLVLRDPAYEGHERFLFQDQEVVSGKYGHHPYAMLSTGAVPHGGDPKGEIISFGGLLQKHGYLLTVSATPKLAEKERKAVIQWMREGIEASGPALHPKWTDEEAKARWNAVVSNPKGRRKLKPFIRTKNFIVLTNSSAGKAFAKKMELSYKAIQKTYPFKDQKGRRLMPVILFRLPEEYHQFCVDVAGYTKAEAESTGGHAYKDYYATYYAAPNDPVHIHEATHQIFRNRLHLSGGGSWFQEGVAEYLATKKGERKAFAKGAARRKRYIDFRNFVKSQRLLSNGIIDGGDAYLQAASVIEFLVEDRKLKKKFPEFLRRIGLCAPNDEDTIDRILTDVYGMDLDGLEKAWRAYWKRR